MTTPDTLTPAEHAALAYHGWRADASFRANGVLLLRFKRGGHTKQMTAGEWRSELRRLEERDDGRQRV